MDEGEHEITKPGLVFLHAGVQDPVFSIVD